MLPCTHRALRKILDHYKHAGCRWLDDMRYLYSACLALLLPFLWLILWWRYRGSDYNKRWRERLGVVAVDRQHPCLWLHTASVGEVIAAKKLIDHLIGHYPNYRLVITTTTPSGAERVAELFADRVRHCYLPYDLPYCILRFLRAFRPAALLIMETEMWPNILACCHRMATPAVLINARMSARSCRAYLRVATLSRPMFAQLTAVVAQTRADAKRLQWLGANNINVSGNIKMDIAVTADLKKQAAALATSWSKRRQRSILIAASTHRGEDEQLLQGLGQLKQWQAAILLVLVPRHPQRAEAIKQCCLQRGYRVRYHSERRVDKNTDIVIVDTIGELMAIYGASHLAFVGGSLVDHGGHNVLEPAAWGLPIITGPSVHNFGAIIDGLIAVEGICVINNNGELAEKLTQLLADRTTREHMGRAAHHYLASNRGALAKLIHCLDAVIAALPIES